MRPRHLITRPLRSLLRATGYDIACTADLHALKQLSGLPADFDARDREDYEAVAPYTVVPPVRIYTLTRAVEYVVAHGIPGALVECGTWKGGCVMAVIRTLLRLGITDRDLYLYDLFGDWWPAPSPHDAHLGVNLHERARQGPVEMPPEMVYTLDEVRENILATGYPPERLHFVPGDVCATIPATAPETAALVRLDTDFHASTLHELHHLYPRLAEGGVLIIDDYGDWAGARKAAGEYFAAHKPPPLLVRVDVGARMGVKPHGAVGPTRGA